MTKFNYDTNEQYWEAKRELARLGYRMTGDAYWTQIFEKDGRVIVLERN